MWNLPSLKSVTDFDYSAANILVSEEGNVQLCDFGVSAMLEHKVDKRSTVLGTPWWMAPELAIGAQVFAPNVSYGKEVSFYSTLAYPTWPQTKFLQVDIWAYGCTLYELATGFPPNIKVHPERLGAVLLEKVPRLEGESYSAGLCELVALCLEERADNRPLITTVQRHPYIFNSQRRFPTSSLRRLVQEFYSWEQSGGQRQSLFFPGGAPVAEMPVEDAEEDAWNFSTTDSFEQDFLTPEAPLAEQTNRNRSLSDSRSTSTSSQAESVSSRRKLHKNPRTQLHPLQRIFDENDSSNYADRYRDFVQAPPLAPIQPAPATHTSDLPLRNQTPQQGSVRDTTIDLGEWDPTSGNIHIPDFSTIRENKGRYSRKVEDEDDFQYPAQDDDDYKKRVTRDWKFPTFESPAEARASMGARPKTQDWKFPTMMQPTLNEEEEEDDQDKASKQLPNLVPAAQLRPRLIHQETAPVQHLNQPLGSLYQETASAPVSPQESMIDLDEAERARPTTSLGGSADDEDLYEASDYAPSDDTSVFGLERHLNQANNDDFEPATVRSSSLSSHRQSRSVPPELDVSKPDVAEGAEPVAAAPQLRRRQSSLDEADRDKEQQALLLERASAIWSDDQREKWQNHTIFGGPSTAERDTTEWNLPSRLTRYEGIQAPSRPGYPNQFGTDPRPGDEDFPGLNGPMYQEYAAEGFPTYQRVVRSLYQRRGPASASPPPRQESALDDLTPEVVRMRQWVDGTMSTGDWVEGGGAGDKTKGKAPTPAPAPVATTVPTILRQDLRNGSVVPNLRQFVPPMGNPPSAEFMTDGASQELVSAELDRLLSEQMRGLEGVMGAMQALAAREQYLARERVKEGKGKGWEK